MEAGTAGQMMLGATQSIALFTALLPSRADLYKAQADSATKQNVRQGEMLATVLTLGFAGALSYLTKDMAPLWIAGASTATLILAYELTLHMTPGGSNVLS